MARDHKISRQNANIEIRQFLNIRKEILSKINIDELSVQAGNFIASGLVSFTFYKNQLDDLFGSVPTANAYRVYAAADSNGQPTIVVVPSKLSEDETSVYNVLSPTEDPGQQYPVPSSTIPSFDSFDIGDE